MSEEEKKAIEYFNRRIKNVKTQYTSIYFKVENLKTLLNLITKLQEDLREMTISNEHKKKEWIHKNCLNSYISKETLRKIKANTDTYRDFTEEVLKLL